MKFWVAIVLLFFMLNSYGQNLDSCGVDNSSHLNSFESVYLNDYFSKQRGSFDFTGKKILFVTGSKGTRIGNKTGYFNDIKLWNKDNSMIATDLILFTEEEKIQSGGFDGMLTYWAKVPPNKNKLFKKIKSYNELE